MNSDKFKNAPIELKTKVETTFGCAAANAKVVFADGAESKVQAGVDCIKAELTK